jgi:hypothetical protein
MDTHRNLPLTIVHLAGAANTGTRWAGAGIAEASMLGE